MLQTVQVDAGEQVWQLLSVHTMLHTVWSVLTEYPVAQATQVPSTTQVSQLATSQMREQVPLVRAKPDLQVAQVEAVVQLAQLASLQMRVQLARSELSRYPGSQVPQLVPSQLRQLLMRSIASLEISCQGLAGYINAAFLI